MVGYELAEFREPLKRVPAHRTKKPAMTLNIEGILGAAFLQKSQEIFEDTDLETILRRMPSKFMVKKFSFDQLCKIRYSQFIQMDRTVEALFEDERQYAIVHKIQNCMWRWGCGSGVWNEVVDAYDGIRNFSIPIADFEVRLDFTTGYNERGRSREARIYLDGVFGFLVYYKGEHVMTLGFSVTKGRRLLIQQVQLAQRKGNRFLFRLPPNRVEFFVERFVAAFPRHKVFIVDGTDICKQNLGSYQLGLDRIVRINEHNTSERIAEERLSLEESIRHLTAELPRLTALYANTGAFRRCSEYVVNGIKHYRLEMPPDAGPGAGAPAALVDCRMSA